MSAPDASAVQRRTAGLTNGAVVDMLEVSAPADAQHTPVHLSPVQAGAPPPRSAKHDRDDDKLRDAPNCGSVFCKCLTVFMAVFVLGDITKQLILGPDITFVPAGTSAALSSSLSSAGAQLSRAASAVAVSFSGGDDAAAPVGEAATLAADGAWSAGWEARTTGGASFDAITSLTGKAFAASFPVANVNNSALIAAGGVAAKLRAMSDMLPGVIVQPLGNATAELAQGTILVVRGRPSHIILSHALVAF